GSWSIGVRPFAALIVQQEHHPQSIWQVAYPTIVHAARIIRLVNDLGTIESDEREGNVSALTLARTHILAHQADLTANALQTAAYAQVNNQITDEIIHFVQTSSECQEGPLLFAIRSAVAAAIAMYGAASPES